MALQIICPVCAHSFATEEAKLRASYGWVSCPECAKVFVVKEDMMYQDSIADFNLLQSFTPPAEPSITAAQAAQEAQQQSADYRVQAEQSQADSNPANPLAEENSASLIPKIKSSTLAHQVLAPVSVKPIISGYSYTQQDLEADPLAAPAAEATAPTSTEAIVPAPNVDTKVSSAPSAPSAGSLAASDVEKSAPSEIKSQAEPRKAAVEYKPSVNEPIAQAIVAPPSEAIRESIPATKSEAKPEVRPTVAPSSSQATITQTASAIAQANKKKTERFATEPIAPSASMKKNVEAKYEPLVEKAIKEESKVRLAKQPSFIQNASKPNWGLRISLLFACLLGAAVGGVYMGRNYLVAMEPALRAPLSSACKLISCKLANYRNLQAFDVEGTTMTDLAEQKNKYRLEVTLKNTDNLAAVEFPAMDLLLTDSDAKPMLHKKISTKEMGVEGKMLAPGQTWAGDMVIEIPLDDTDKLRMAGYKVEVYYP